MSDSAVSWTVACQAPLSFAQTHVHWVNDSSFHLILCHSLLLLLSIFLSIRVFSSESALCIRWPKYWSFGFSINPFNDYSGWFPLGNYDEHRATHVFLNYCFSFLQISTQKWSSWVIWLFYTYFFWRISILFSIQVAPIYISINIVWGFPFLHICSNTCYFLSFSWPL